MDMSIYPLPFKFAWNFTFPEDQLEEIEEWLGSQGMVRWAWNYGPGHFVTLYLAEEDDALLVKLTWV